MGNDGDRLRGNLDPSQRRYIKWAWNSAQYAPPLNQVDYVPKDGGAFHVYGEGTFVSKGAVESFPTTKTDSKLPSLGKCAYCGASDATHKLTSEHIIPEFLGAGLEVLHASCETCQESTSEFESTVAAEIFDAVRKNLGVEGKRGVIKKLQFRLDIGREVTKNLFLPITEHPTVICMPFLFPASAYSGRPANTDGVFNLRVYNLNADISKLVNIGVDGFSTVVIDSVRFCQLIAKIGHAYAAIKTNLKYTPGNNGGFIGNSIPPKTSFTSHYNHVGCLWQHKESSTSDLHQVELGDIDYEGLIVPAARVRLFANFGMPSYFVAL